MLLKPVQCAPASLYPHFDICDTMLAPCATPPTKPPPPVPPLDPHLHLDLRNHISSERTSLDKRPPIMSAATTSCSVGSHHAAPCATPPTKAPPPVPPLDPHLHLYLRNHTSSERTSLEIWMSITGEPFPPGEKEPMQLSIDATHSVAQVEERIAFYTHFRVKIAAPNCACPNDSLLDICAAQGMHTIIVVILEDKRPPVMSAATTSCSVGSHHAATSE